MEIGSLLSNLGLGLSVALSLQNLFWCLMGAVIGTAVGVLPGVGPVATMALLLPATYFLQPEAALIMLAGIYYGAQYGGSTTAILVNLPGEASSVVTTLDGHQMARQGRAGPALAIAAIGSFFAGCVATVAIAAAAPPLTKLAQQFAPADYFSLMTLGLVFAVVLARGSVIKAVGMIFLGMLLGLVGTDVNTGNTRFTFGIGDLFDGIGFVPLVMGIFGIAEIMNNLTDPQRRDLVSSRVSGLLPTREDLERSIAPILRGTALGGLLGILPGGGAVLGSFSSYTMEKRLSKTPEKFGTGMIEGVAGPESANNAAAQTSFIPMLTLGIPSNAVMAEAGPVLGHDREHVARQPDVARAQPAADRHLGADAARALPTARHCHPVLLLHRCLQPQQLGQRGARHRPVRGSGLPPHEARLRARAASDGLLARADDGGLHAPRHVALARRPAGIPAAAAVADVPSDRCPAAAVRHSAGGPQGPGNGVPGVKHRRRQAPATHLQQQGSSSREVPTCIVASSWRWRGRRSPPAPPPSPARRWRKPRVGRSAPSA
jgi:TctA family transporter